MIYKIYFTAIHSFRARLDCNSNCGVFIDTMDCVSVDYISIVRSGIVLYNIRMLSWALKKYQHFHFTEDGMQFSDNFSYISDAIYNVVSVERDQFSKIYGCEIT